MATATRERSIVFLARGSGTYLIFIKIYKVYNVVPGTTSNVPSKVQVMLENKNICWRIRISQISQQQTTQMSPQNLTTQEPIPARLLK